MRYLLLTPCLLVLMSLSLYSQEQTLPSITKSTDRVKIEGKNYYIHIVRPGETLYSISRAYGVSQIDIAMENQDIYLGLQPDQALKIPIPEGSTDAITSDKDDEFIYHVVRKGETLYGLSRRYNVPINAIIKLNPEVDEGIKLSQVVLIPNSTGITKTDTEPIAKPDEFIYHEVQPQEGFFTLQRLYGASEEVIRYYNSDLVRDGLKLGTVLRIPVNPDQRAAIGQEPFTPKEETPPPDSNLFAAATSLCETLLGSDVDYEFNVVLLLPFIDDSHSVINSTNPDDSNNDSQRLHQAVRFMEFYQGFLIALDTLKRMGLSVNLWVHDTHKDANKVKALLKKDEFAKANLIVGPVYPETLKPVADFAREHRIPIISPLSPNNYLLNNNPFLFQVNPSFNSQLEEFFNILNPCDGQNIVIIHEGDTTNISLINNFKNLTKNRIAQCQSASKSHFKEVTYRPGSPAAEMLQIISHSLVQERENMILVPSNDEAFVIDLLGNLNALNAHHGYPISLYGFPRWQRLRNVELDLYYQLKLHLFTPYHVSYANPLVQWFVNSFRFHYRTEPSQFAFQGYDVAFFFLSAMRQYGVDFQYCVQHHNPELTQTKYNFKQVNPISGYENKSIHLLRYNKHYLIETINAP